MSKSVNKIKIQFGEYKKIRKHSSQIKEFFRKEIVNQYGNLNQFCISKNLFYPRIHQVLNSPSRMEMTTLQKFIDTLKLTHFEVEV